MKKDAIIILGGGIKADGSLPNEVKSRIKKGIELYKKGYAPRIILSGAYSFLSKYPPPKTEAEVMKDYAVYLGFNKNNLLLENESQDTIGNAYLTKIRILLPRDWKSITVVTSDYHIARTKYIFKKVLGAGYKITFVPAPSNLSKHKLKIELKNEHKKFALAKYIFNILKNFSDFNQ